MAIEDAVTLSELFSSDTEKRDIVGRLELYEEIRKPRVGRVRDSGRENAKGLDQEDPTHMMKYMKFLSEHDAVEHARKALSSYLATDS